MRVTRVPVPRDDVDVPGCELDAGAGGMLPNGIAVELLPRRLALGHRDAAIHPPALVQFVARDQNVRRPLIEVDAHAIARLEQRQTPARRCLR
jgi:hypothetical protein